MSKYHTPTPWRTGMKPGPMIYSVNGGAQIADCRNIFLPDNEDGHNARLIITAVNSHDALVAACQAMLAALTDPDSDALDMMQQAALERKLFLRIL